MAGLGKRSLCYRLFLKYGKPCGGSAWMSNWQYCNIVPTRQFRSANALPRELGLYTQDNDIYLSAAPVAETKNLQKRKQGYSVFYGRQGLSHRIFID